MEKEQILSTINEKLGNTNFSEKTISDYVDTFIPETEETPDFDKHVGFLKSLYGNFSADVAKQVNEAKAKLQTPPANKQQPDETRYAALEEKFDKLMGNYEKLTERLAQKESQQTQEQLMAQVRTTMVSKGANDEYVLKKTLQGKTLDTKKSVAELAEELLKSYDSELTDCRGKGAAPRNGGTSGGAKDKPFGGYFAQKKAKEGWGKDPK